MHKSGIPYDSPPERKYTQNCRARNASGQDQIDYIKQARIEFNQAVAVEENENKLLALVGLSMCQYLLGDGYNSRQTLNKVKGVVETYNRINQSSKSADLNKALNYSMSVIAFGEHVINYMRHASSIDIYDLHDKHEEKAFSELIKPVIDDPEKIAKREFERLY